MRSDHHSHADFPRAHDGFSISRRAMLGGLAASATLPAPRRALAEIVSTVAVGSNGWLYPTWDEVRMAKPAMIAKTVPTIGQVVSAFKQNGIDVAISLTPSKARVYPQYLPSDFQPVADATARYPAALAALRGTGAVVPDLATLFAGLAQLPPPPAGPSASTDFVPVGADLFFKADTHWTTMASLPAAAVFAMEIGASLQLPAASGPGSQLGAPVETLQEQNDLAGLLPAADQSKYPFESYMLPAVAGATGDNALIATTAADTVVIGNSYMQPKYGFADTLSSNLGRPVSLFWKIDRFGPYATLTEFLKGDLFKQQRPKLIVWNFRESQLEHLCDDDDFFGSNAMSPADLVAAVKQATG